ncbi:AAA family ATPase [Prauserella muralis]|uniref:DNA repair protein RadA n=1 Tax=Prauserella muralis TaxID=588067 RepID=A0A2V4BM08_9PSEU|nr:AAA family ATPase [Prauserella muralis]PXY31683.1 DNA repair protein RadA [Prauserella muralis]TWE13941.1 AAA domain-containing protein [Prauserella muralis]
MTSVRALSAVPDHPARRTRWTDAELLAVDFPEPRWAVPGLLCEGLNLLAGAPKLGKSWLSLGLGAAIANGDPALNAIEVERGPVLYCALEDTGRRLQRRRRQMLAAGGRPAALLTLETACPTMSMGGAEVITEWLEDNPHARLVIIDTFAKMRGADPHGMTQYAADYAAASRFKDLADRYSVPFLLIHHVRKQAADDFQSLVSGTNGLTGAVDATLVLERARGQADGVLHVTGRDVEEADYAMSFDAHAGAWTKLDGPAGDYLMQDTRALVMRFVRDYPGSKPADIAKALDLNPGTVRQTCKRMADKGQLHAAPGGTYHPPDTGDSSGDTPELSHLSLRHSTTSDQGEHL